MGVDYKAMQNLNILKPDNSQKETTFKIEGCDSYENLSKLKDCLAYYGEVLSEITENTHYDPDPNAQPVGCRKQIISGGTFIFNM